MECTYDPMMPNKEPTLIYPRNGDGSIVIGMKSVLVGELKTVYDQGSKAYDRCSQCIDFTFNPPVLISECNVEVYLSNCSINGSNASIGVYQFYVAGQ